MKKYRGWLQALAPLLAALFLTLMSPLPAQAATLPLFLNGELLSLPAPPLLTNGRLLVPLRAFLEAQGAQVTWLPPDTVRAQLHGRSVEMVLGNVMAKANGQMVTADPPARIIDGHTYAGARFLSEALGATVEYIGRAVYVRWSKRIQVVDGPLNVRQAPSTQFPTLVTVPSGTVLEAVRTQGDWSQVRLPPDRLGWVASRYTGPAPVILPYGGTTALAEVGGECLGPVPLVNSQMYIPRGEVALRMGIPAPVGSSELVSARSLAESLSLNLTWDGARRTAALAGAARGNGPGPCSPTAGAAAYLILDGATGLVLAEQGANWRLSVASTTKIMTAVLALEQGKLESLVTISRRAANTECTCASLKAGERRSLGDLLYGLMLPSGNDAAVAIAEHLAGSEAAFAVAMNRRAQEMELNNTRFLDASGLDDRGYSTAHDMAIIARHAMEMPMFRAVVSARQHKAGGTKLLSNLNRFMSTYSGATGVKNGWTPAAGHTLVASAYQSGRELIVVLLGAPTKESLYTQAAQLMEYGFRLSDSSWMLQAGLGYEPTAM